MGTCNWFFFSNTSHRHHTVLLENEINVQIENRLKSAVYNNQWLVLRALLYHALGGKDLLRECFPQFSQGIIVSLVVGWVRGHGL